MLGGFFRRRRFRNKGIDALLAHVSVMDGVVYVQLNADQSIAVYVLEPLEQALPKVAALVDEIAPGTQGMVHRLAPGAVGSAPIGVVH